MAANLEAVKAKVRSIPGELGPVKLTDNDSSWSKVGSTVVSVQVRHEPEVSDLTYLHVVAPELRDVERGPHMYEYVARISNMLVFGHLTSSVGSDDDHSHLLITHNLLGDYLDAGELLQAVQQMASLADDLDESLQAKFSGMTSWESY